MKQYLKIIDRLEKALDKADADLHELSFADDVKVILAARNLRTRIREFRRGAFAGRERAKRIVETAGRPREEVAETRERTLVK